VTFFVVGAHGHAPPVPAPTPLLCRRQPWLALVVTALVSGCTLTQESFEPGLVDRSQAASSPAGAPAGPPPAGAAGESETGGPSGVSEGPAEGGGEGDIDPPLVLDPTGNEGGQLGGSGELATADAGGEGEPVALPDPIEPSEPDAGVVVPVEPSCPSVAFGASCYEFIGVPAAWVAAEASCVAWGGHLASVGSAQEDAFLANWPAQLGVNFFDGSGIWIGGTDAAQEGQFTWSDASPVAFSGWAPNQPDNGIGVDCIEKRNDGTQRWYDQRCIDQRVYVCERPL
jgi:hypothetical protein